MKYSWTPIFIDCVILMYFIPGKELPVYIANVTTRPAIPSKGVKVVSASIHPTGIVCFESKNGMGWSQNRTKRRRATVFGTVIPLIPLTTGRWSAETKKNIETTHLKISHKLRSVLAISTNDRLRLCNALQEIYFHCQTLWQHQYVGRFSRCMKNVLHRENIQVICENLIITLCYR